MKKNKKSKNKIKKQTQTGNAPIYEGKKRKVGSIMKQEAITKINKMGKVGQIFALIAKILLGIGIAMMLAVTIATAFIPKEFVKITTGATAQVEIDLTSIGVKLSKDDIQKINNSEVEIKNTAVNANDVEYNVNKMTANEKGIVVDVAADNITFNLHSMFGIMLISTIALILSFVTIWFVGALCKAVAQCQTPFEENIIRKLQNLAYSLIPWAFFTTVSDGMVTGMMTGKTQFNVGVDLGMVLVIVIIFALTYIFKYGAVLQQESDETL